MEKDKNTIDEMDPPDAELYDAHEDDHDEEYDEEWEADIDEYENEFADVSFDPEDYDDHADTAERFEKYLLPGEHILWSASSVRNASLKEADTGCSTCIASLLILEPLLFIYWLPVVGIVFILLGVLLMIRIKTVRRRYAVTDCGILMLKGWRFRRIPFDRVDRIHFKSSERKVGTVTFQRDFKINSYGNKVRKYARIRAVKKPSAVYHILYRAASDYLKSRDMLTPDMLL